MIPSANMRPALGPPTSRRLIVTLTGKSDRSCGAMPITGRTGASVERPVVIVTVPGRPARV